MEKGRTGIDCVAVKHGAAAGLRSTAMRLARMQDGIAVFASPHLELRDGAGEMLRLESGPLASFPVSASPWVENHACPGDEAPASYEHEHASAVYYG